jgi:hypothetical protein
MFETFIDGRVVREAAELYAAEEQFNGNQIRKPVKTNLMWFISA